MLSCVCPVIDHRWRPKCGENKKGGTRGAAECVTTFWLFLGSITESDARQHGIYLFYIIAKRLFLFQKYFNINAKSRPFCFAFARKKKPFDVIYDLYKMKQFHWLLCVAKNCDWSRKIAPLSNLARVSLLVEWKLTAEAKLNCEIYKSWKKCWKNQVSFCHRSSLVSQKAWTLPWKLQELKKIPSENLWLRST